LRKHIKKDHLGKRRAMDDLEVEPESEDGVFEDAAPREDT